MFDHIPNDHILFRPNIKISFNNYNFFIAITTKSFDF